MWPTPNQGVLAPAQMEQATMPIFGMDGPHRTTTNLTGAIFRIRPLGRDMGVGLRYPQVQK